jgi:uncharacterized pyridoxamine 5'-phosphate oxidase family protein
MITLLIRVTAKRKETYKNELGKSENFFVTCSKEIKVLAAIAIFSKNIVSSPIRCSVILQAKQALESLWATSQQSVMSVFLFAVRRKSEKHYFSKLVQMDYIDSWQLTVKSWHHDATLSASNVSVENLDKMLSA